MASFYGTNDADTVSSTGLSTGVTSDPADSLPGDAGDSYRLYDGADTLFAGDGPDDIVTGYGGDWVDAGGGDDMIWEFVSWIESGDDEFHGGAGDDEIWGGAGADDLWGDDGDDRLYGGDDGNIYDDDGDDKLYGGAGADYLAGGLDADEIDGGDGNDTLYAEREIDPSSGIDTLFDTTANHLRGGAGDDTLYGALGADLLYGDDGDDALRGGDGGDTLSGGGGDDALYGGAGSDRLVGGDGNDEIDGGDGRDEYVGLEGDDRFYVSDYDEQLGEYVLRSETVKAGQGSDTLVLDRLTGLDIDLGRGVATWSQNSARLSLVRVENVQCGTDVTVRGSDADNSIEGSGDGTFRGLGGDDFLLSDNASLRAFGGTGNDMLLGGREGDRLYGDEGADSVDGRAGDDLLFGGSGNDDIAGHNELDVLVGGSGDDILSGGYQSDTCFGGTGRDTFLFLSPDASKYDDIDHIRGGAPKAGPKAGMVEEAFEKPDAGKGDLIDVHWIDSDDSRDGNQPFVFGVQRQGGLWLKDIGDVTVVLGNIDPDDTAEFVVYIHDGDRYRAEDYSAADFVL